MFTIEQIDILIEAVDLWEREFKSESPFSILFESIINSDGEDEIKNKFSSKMKEEKNRIESDIRERKYKAIKLKALLVEMREKILMDELLLEKSNRKNQ